MVKHGSFQPKTSCIAEKHTQNPARADPSQAHTSTMWWRRSHGLQVCSGSWGPIPERLATKLHICAWGANVYMGKWQLVHSGFMNTCAFLPQHAHEKLKVNSCIFKVFYLQMFPPQSLLRLKTPSSAAFDGTRICDISRWLHRIGIMFLSGGCMWDESNFRQDTTKLFGYVFPFLELSHRLLGVLRV